MQSGNANINFNQLNQQNNLQLINSNTVANSAQRLSSSPISKLQADLTSLIKGDILKGEIIDLRGSDIQILLNDGQTLKASFESSIPLYIGDHASFLVEESNKDSLHLKLLPVENNASTDATIDKALEEAFLPKNDKNITIVQELLKYGLSIDKKSIMNMLRQSAAFRNVSIETLAIMNKYQIPMNQENTTQLEAYRNYEFRLVEQGKQLTDSITSVLARLPEDSPILKEFYSLFPDSSEIVESDSTVNTEPMAPDNLTLFNPGDPKIDVQEDKPVFEANLLKNAQSSKEPLPLQEDQVNRTNQQSASQATPLTSAEVPSQETLLATILRNEFTIPLHKLTQSNSISRFYEKLEQDLDNIHSFFAQHQALTSKEEKDTILSQTSSVKDNIDFMKTLNQLFGYIQLPMKLPDKEVHSELFVYTNKKKLKESSQQVSVLLHLDMTHLGPIDFHLSLINRLVTAKISMEDSNGMALMEQHLPELIHVLETKGYQMTYQMEKLEKESKVIRDAFEHNSSDLLMRRYSFDIRA